MTTSGVTPTESGFATERNPQLRLLIPMIVAIAFLMEQLDSTIITTAIPDIAASLGTTPVRMNLAVTTYVLTLAVFIPVSGWFADRFGARRIFTLALLTFTIASALCGMADTFPFLVAMRALQGLGGAMMTPVGRLILLRSFPRSDLVTAMTYVTLPAIVGPLMGPLLGGFITTYSSWRWIFYVNLPFGLLGMALALRFVEDYREDTPASFDFVGFLLVGCGIAMLQLGLESIGKPAMSWPEIAGTLLAAVVLLVSYARYARSVKAPAVDLSLFGHRTFAVGTLAGGLCRIAMNAPPFLIPLMLQVGFGFSPVTSGALTFVSSFGAILIRLLASRLLRSFGFDRVLSGSAVAGSLVLAGFSFIDAETPRWLIGGYVFVFGLVRSTQFITSNTLSYSDMPADKLSRATSLGGVLQQLTVSFGVSLSATLLAIVTWRGEVLTASRFHEVFMIMAVLPLIALPGFLLLRPEDGSQVSGYVPKSR